MSEKCVQCGGIGQVGMLLPVFRNLREQIQAGYGSNVRECDVCNGTGMVTLERQFYTRNPNQSFDAFSEVIRQNGQLIEVYIPKELSEEVWFRFRNSKQFVFGACSIGYKGDRPRNFLTFLQRAGYEITLDEISEMRAPVLLKQGFGAPKVAEGKGKEPSDAREDALSKVPTGALITDEKIIAGGSPLFAEASADSLESARAKAIASLPPDAQIEDEEILSEPRIQEMSSFGISEEAARRSLSRRHPNAELKLLSKSVFKATYSAAFPAAFRLKYTQPVTVLVTYLSGPPHGGRGFADTPHAQPPDAAVTEERARCDKPKVQEKVNASSNQSAAGIQVVVASGRLAHNIGIETIGGAFTALIEAGVQIPCERREVFSTAVDNQRVIEVHVLEGASKTATDNRSLGTFKLMDLPTERRGVPQIEVTFRVQPNSEFCLTARDLTTLRDLPVVCVVKQDRAVQASSLPTTPSKETEEKVPCRKCGKMILKRMAALHDGCCTGCTTRTVFARENFPPATSADEAREGSFSVYPPRTKDSREGGLMMRGIETLEKYCTALDLLDPEALLRRSISELKPEGAQAADALAKLIRELLECRSGKLPGVLYVAGALEPTPELVQAVRAVLSADGLAPAPIRARFTPLISGGGKIGWDDFTQGRVKTLATRALDAFPKKKTNP